MIYNAIFKGLRQRPLSLTRHASKGTRKTKGDKIPIQLLKDFPKLGLKGEVVYVKPAYMRNYLHMNNGACYITSTQGPRIPVVERPARASKPILEVLDEEKSKVESAPSTQPQAMSLDELASLFKNIKKGSKKSHAKDEILEQTFTAAESGTYTLSELRTTLPEQIRIRIEDEDSVAIEKKDIASLLFKITGISVPTSEIKITDPLNGLSTMLIITKPGSYTLVLTSPDEGANIKKTLVVK